MLHVGSLMYSAEYSALVLVFKMQRGPGVAALSAFVCQHRRLNSLLVFKHWNGKTCPP